MLVWTLYDVSSAPRGSVLRRCPGWQERCDHRWRCAAPLFYPKKPGLAMPLRPAIRRLQVDHALLQRPDHGVGRSLTSRLAMMALT